MKRKDNLLTSLLGPAALLLMAATALVITSCSQDNEEPGGTTPEGRITLAPTVAPVAAWSTDGSDASGTRADATVPASLTGGEIAIEISTLGADGNSAGTKIGCNYYSVSADGKLTRLPYDPGNLDETEAPLAVDAAGDYWVNAGGPVTLATDDIGYGSHLLMSGAKVTIGADGTFTLPLSIATGGLRLNVKNTDSTAYIGADVTATLKTVSLYSGTTFDAKTLTSAAPATIWGNISPSNSVTAGTQLLELSVAGKTYKVNAPRQISFTAARLYTFNVRVGATGITVSSDDLGIKDFEAEPVTNAEAKPVPLYNGQSVNELAISGQTAFWVAPEDASTSTQWGNINFSTICPAGWHVPTKDEFVAMTGITAGSSSASTNNDAIKAAFPAGDSYWSSTDGGTSNAWILYVDTDGASYIDNLNKTSSYRVRCVRAQ